MRNIGRAGSANRPSPNIRDDIGRAGSPSQLQNTKSGRVGSPNTGTEIGRAGSPNRPLPNPSHKNGALGESAPPSALPESALPTRKRLIHTPPPWAQEGSTFFITINCIPRGQNQLAIPAIAALIEESLRVRIEKGYWWPRLTLLMPDHIHTLIIFSPDQEMAKVIKDWKRYLARHAGVHWQRDFFDHRIRNEASLQEKWSYILQNPIRAGLVTAAEHWPYVWIGRDDSPNRPWPNIKNDLGRVGSPSRPSPSQPSGGADSPNINDDIGRVGSASRPQPNRPSLNVEDDLGRDGSPSRPSPSRSSYKNGALAESALPESALPNALPNPAQQNPLPTTSKKP